MKLPLTWRKANPERQTTIDPAHAGEADSVNPIKQNATPNPYVDRWSEIVLQFSNLDLLTGPLNTIIFGTQQMGRAAVTQRLANMMNLRFGQEHHAGIYVEMAPIVSTATVYNFTSVDTLYRNLVIQPFSWAARQFHVPDDREQQKAALQMGTLLNVPIAKIDALAIRDMLLHFLDRLGIQHLSYVIDDLSVLAPEFTPVLLQLLIDTFPRGGRVSFKVGGTKQSIKLLERSQHSTLGMQFGHDIVVGLDIEQVLQSSDLKASQFDPRQVFLVSCIEQISPELAAPLKEASDPTWDRLFEPADAWNVLFTGAQYDIELLGSALENLLTAYRTLHLPKIDVPRINQAMELAKAQAGMQKLPLKPK